MSRGCISLIQILMSIDICTYTQIYVCFCVIHEILIHFGRLEHHKWIKTGLVKKKWCLANCWWINKFNCTATSKKYIYIYTHIQTHTVRAKSFTSCLTLCDSMDWSLPVSSVHGILQARLLELVALPSSRESSWPRDRTQVCYVSCTGRQVLYQ